MAGAGAKPLEWLPGARRAFNATLDRIAEDDLETAELVRSRVERAFNLIRSHPGIGTTTPT